MKLIHVAFSFWRPVCCAVAALMLVAVSSCSTGKKAEKASSPDYSAEIYKHGHRLSKQQERMLDEAMTWLGTPYKYGGAEKGEGTDCSGLVTRIYLEMTEIKLPRQSAKQAEFCKSLKQKEVHACDLVFFATGKDPNRVSHVGLLLDEETFIHASSSKGVCITRLDNPWYSKRLLGFGRVPGFK